MKKRKLLKSALAGSLATSWTSPVVTVILLPAHASTSCNDIKWHRGIGFASSCKTDLIEIYYEIILLSDISGNSSGLFTGDVYDVYSNNPVHEIRWKVRLPEQPFGLDIYIKERLLEGDVCDVNHFYLLSDLSPGQLFIETSCGTLTIELGEG